MFTPEARERLRHDLLETAATDNRITSGAITGSAAVGAEDRWSDIDLAFAVGDPADVPHVLSDWTNHMYQAHSALHHLDVASGVWLYRVFLLANTLQVDLAFTPASEFRALAPTFRLVFGTANEPRHAQAREPAELVGWGWLYALHARSCIARRRLWQAEYMISGVRDTALALACVRHELPTAYGRGMDMLPKTVTSKFEEAFVRHLDTGEVARAFSAATSGLLSEIRSADPKIADRLEEALTSLAR
jgi:hypothetical protein